jgi:threonylcarbamoyladenosine tRNA methylthiotransferase MtaB
MGRLRVSAAQVIGLGCRLNIAESERIGEMLAGERDLVVVNSCSVTGEAVRHTRRAIRRARRDNPSARLVVTGCAAETESAALAAMSEVDGLVSNTAKLLPTSYRVEVPTRATSVARIRTRAFVPIQNGCDHACTFCIIPQGRGPSRSLPVAAVIEDIEAHLARGVAEIVLTGVDVTSWGADLAGAPKLGNLIASILGAFPDLARLRLSSLDGAEIDPLLEDLIAGEARVMPHLHLSLQHGHDLILKRMKRRHSRIDAENLVASLRHRRPDIAIGADLIAGFPTEREEHHQANLSLIRELRIVHGHVFPFSPRHDTPAARMPQLDPATVAARAAEMRAAVATTRAEWLASLVGTPLRVLAERDNRGYAENYARVATPGIAPGIVATITPTACEDDLLR